MNTALIEKYLFRCNLDGLVTHGNKYIARCPICGDSDKKRKKRFYILVRDSMVVCYCHNCSYNRSFSSFLKEHRGSVYEEFRKDYLLSKVHRLNSNATIPKNSKPKINDHSGVLDKVERVTGGIALDYCLSRRFSDSFIKQLYYTDNYIQLLNDLKIWETDYKPKEDRRILIPFYSLENKLTHIQARAIDNSAKMRYITTTIVDDAVKVWGANNIDKDKPIYVLEGPIDASFIDNSISFASSNPIFSYLKNNFSNSKIYCMFDNDIHTNKEIRKVAAKCLSEGYGLVLFSKEYSLRYKDVNEMIIGGISRADININVQNCSYDALTAKVRLKMIRSL